MLTLYIPPETLERVSSEGGGLAIVRLRPILVLLILAVHRAHTHPRVRLVSTMDGWGGGVNNFKLDGDVKLIAITAPLDHAVSSLLRTSVRAMHAASS
jgi:hypothetical protein